MARIGFILKPKQNNEARTLLNSLADWAHHHGHEAIVLAEDQANPPHSTIVPEEKFSGAVDFCVALGGDGTILRACRALADKDIPLLGIHLGRLGFLSPFVPEESIQTLERAISKQLSTTTRMRLKVTYRPKNGEAITRTALNDVVISQGAMARLVELHAYLDKHFINSYRADGLVVSSPTGSTAYNLAAGGPIMYPGMNAMAITPICAQGLTNRSLVVPSDRHVHVSIKGESQGVVLTIDGQWAHTFLPGDTVDIIASPTPLTIFDSDNDYFNILRAKLHWGITPVK